MSKKKISTITFKQTKEKEKKLLEIIETYKKEEGPLLPILQETQEVYGYLPYEVMQIISEKLGISIEKIYGVATFYTQFRLTPTGKYQINLCMGTVCYIKGSNEILEELTNILGIKDGECTTDGKFSIDTTRCLGCCGMAPVMMINNDVYGEISRKDVKGILEKYQ